MFFVILKFSGNDVLADKYMNSHLAYVKRGFDDGVFLVGGPIVPNLGGGLLAHGISRAELEARVSTDPFVAEGVVVAEIIEIDPLEMDKRLESIIL